MPTSEVKTNKIAISSPWITAVKKINALFAGDSDLDVIYDDDTKTIRIESINSYKITALQRILKPTLVFGNITLNIKCLVKDGNDTSVTSDFKTAFAGNPHIVDVIETPTPMSDAETYVIFKKEVLQFFNDDISDYYGNWNGLSEDIMRDLCNEKVRANFGTDVHEPAKD